ncbi:hypothetical protein HN51_033959 [Arachis hypogaea]|uniref:Uncharacterized protein n=1 Tax=Arachis hypogaea TaxID=3818 RepID=A0A445A9W2_ARAHY|nr:uncharacterized protein LOC112735706 [Arachis hypogaea]QHN98721.1 uncharacterized protein DS421_13g391980 [Arachis hypogaea]RYR23236.1 hypothetical protein Ahy_B03g068494 [Arachis hypogaea]
MDPLPTPLPVKANDSKQRINANVKQASTKIATNESQIQSRQNRVFGTARNTNIMGKPVWDKCTTTTTTTKPKICVPKKQAPKSSSSVSSTNPAENVNNSPRLLNDAGEPKTPHVRTNHKGSKPPATPFYTAAHCSKCRFDKLETSSYWIGQIKLAESVGKHFVAADFFRLASESMAEPIRNLRMELKRYLLRHEYLSEQKIWKEVRVKYGLLKIESNNNDASQIMDSSSNDQNKMEEKLS